MAVLFQIDEHVIDSQHIRHHPGGSRDQETALKLHIKQYSPLDNLDPKAGDFTIIAVHANGCIKELYEPLFEEILLATKNSDFQIRSIWIADVAQQGASAVLNEPKLGNDTHYFDLSRDLLHMVNVFRDQMPRPILGIGHSVGGTSLAFLSFMHPRLFTSLILIEPAIYRDGSPQGGPLLTYTSLKRDFWKSKAELESWVRRNPIYKDWDQRVIKRLLRFGVRKTPSLLHQDEGFTFTTPKHQEAFMVARPRSRGVRDDARSLLAPEDQDSTRHVAQAVNKSPFYNAECREAFRILPFLKPSTLFVNASQTAFTSLEQRQSVLRVTGTGPGGSGGAELGQVSGVVLDGGHSLPFEEVLKTAKTIVHFADEQGKRWKIDEQEWQKKWLQKSPVERQTMDDKWLGHVKKLRLLSKL